MASEDHQATLYDAIQKDDFEVVRAVLQTHPELANCTFQLPRKQGFITPLIAACEKGKHYQLQ